MMKVVANLSVLGVTLTNMLRVCADEIFRQESTIYGCEFLKVILNFSQWLPSDSRALGSAGRT
jgi:hypothetical protein